MPHQNNNIDQDFLQSYLYDQVYENIDSIIEKYDNVLNPEVNSLTKDFFIETGNLKHSYALTFTIFLMFLKKDI